MLLTEWYIPNTILLKCPQKALDAIRCHSLSVAVHPQPVLNDIVNVALIAEAAV